MTTLTPDIIARCNTSDFINLVVFDFVDNVTLEMVNKWWVNFRCHEEGQELGPYKGKVDPKGCFETERASHHYKMIRPYFLTFLRDPEVTISFVFEAEPTSEAKPTSEATGKEPTSEAETKVEIMSLLMDKNSLRIVHTDENPDVKCMIVYDQRPNDPHLLFRKNTPWTDGRYLVFLCVAKKGGNNPPIEYLHDGFKRGSIIITTLSKEL